MDALQYVAIFYAIFIALSAAALYACRAVYQAYTRRKKEMNMQDAVRRYDENMRRIHESFNLKK